MSCLSSVISGFGDVSVHDSPAMAVSSMSHTGIEGESL